MTARLTALRLGAVAVLASLATACSSSAVAGHSAATTSHRSSVQPVPTSSTTTSPSPAAHPLTNCDLLTKDEVREAFGVHVLKPKIDPQVGWCEYNAKDAAAGGLGVRVSLVNPNGERAYRMLKGSYQLVNGSLDPGEYELVTGIGTECFFAIDLGGAWTMAAVRGDVDVVIQIGGTKFQSTVDGNRLANGLRSLMSVALNRAVQGIPAS